MATPPATVSPAPALPATETGTAGADAVTVEVAHARPERQCLLAVTVPAGSTVAEVLAQSGLQHVFPDLDWQVQPVGIWSRPVPLTTPVQPGDRIEVYRPLQLSPATTLRQRDKTRRKERGLPPRTK